MFDIGWSELLLVAVLAIVFVGPKDLPRLMRTLGQYTAKMRAMAREFQNSFEDMARETELDELRKQVAELRHDAMRPLSDIPRIVETPDVETPNAAKPHIAPPPGETGAVAPVESEASAQPKTMGPA